MGESSDTISEPAAAATTHVELDGGEDEQDPESNSLHQPLLKRSPTLSASHLAMVGAKVSHIESLDYEINESYLFKHDWRRRSNVQVLQYVFGKWTLAFLVGLLTGVIASLINLAIENIAGIKMLHVGKLRRESWWRCRYITGFVYLTGLNFVLTTVAAALCVVFAPTAAGPGIPEIKAYLNGVDTPNMFGVSTLIVKIIGSIGAVSAGLDLGKEGPLVHIGACLANLLSQGGSENYHLKWRWLRYFKNDRDRRDLITCGASSGVCAAFRSPVGGVLFSLEEVATWWRSALLWRTFFSTAVVVVVLRGFMEFCNSGKCGLFGRGGLILFDVSNVTVTYHINDLLPVAAVGVIGGLLGSLYNHLLHKVLRLYNMINEKGRLAKLALSLSVSYGRLLGVALGSYTNIDQGLYAVLGAAALMSGSMRMTVSLCVIFLELTNNLLLLPITMFVLLIAKTVGDAFNLSIYEIILELKGLPFLEANPEPWMRNITVGELAAAKPCLVSLQVVEKVSRVVDVLRSTSHNGFPVVDEGVPSPTRTNAAVTEVHGLVLRSHIIAVLKKKWFLKEKRRTEEWEVRDKFTSVDLAEKGARIEELEITDEEMEMYIDLHPFTNTTPYTVVETMSVAKAMVLFRQVGLRHLLIVPKYQGAGITPIVGILTRQDLRAHNILNAFPHLANKRDEKRTTSS
ncbi:Chloride channel protein CLC-b [Ananas comosus]|uniref:Chloride channel protein n=1 Tax=Ananas comosus TaxID=4615 RepID=A0A199V8Z6_ANACO|nr:Chloride channel protein CLC-b [Ananas comosus]